MGRINSFHSEQLLEGNYYPKINAYYYREWNNHSTKLHAHKHVEIMYVIQGNCVVEAESEVFAMKKGDFILLNADILHRLIVEKDSPCRMMNVEFFFQRDKSQYPCIKELANYSPSLLFLLNLPKDFLFLKDTDEIYSALKNLIIELDTQTEDSPLLIHILLSQLLIKIGQLANEERERDSIAGTIYIKQALNYIYSNYDCDISIKDIASFINIHPAYLQRIFKKSTGYTIIDYLTNIRIDKAKMLLSSTNIPAIEIPGYIGINSVQYFYFLFKKHTGLTPIQFRKSTSKSFRDKSNIL